MKNVMLKSRKQVWMEVWELLSWEVMVAWEMGLFVNNGHNYGSHTGFPPFLILHRSVSRVCPFATTKPMRGCRKKHTAEKQPNS